MEWISLLPNCFLTTGYGDFRQMRGIYNMPDTSRSCLFSKLIRLNESRFMRSVNAAKLVILLDKYKNTPDMEKAGIEYATKQIQDLIDNGVGVHINTMNRVNSTYEILRNIGRL